MAYPEPNDLDDIYEGGDVPDEHGDAEELEQCAECGHSWPTSKLDDGICPDCRLFQRELERSYLDYIEARERRDEYNRIVDGEYAVSDSGPGL